MVARVGFLHPKQTARGRALIIKAKGLAQMSSGTGFAWQNPISTVASRIHVRVTPEESGPDFESQATVIGGEESYLAEGHWTYVLFDPQHPESCHLDVDRLMKEFGPADGKKRCTIPQWWAEEKFEGVVQDPKQITVTSGGGQDSGDGASGTQDVVTGLQNLAQLHATGALTDAEFAEAKARLLAEPGPA